jgi:mannose-6-phosphate isomerase
MLYPFLFEPLFKERIWGGRLLETLYRKPLPPIVPIGESWEICDRPEDQSVVANGPMAGKSLRYLMEKFGPELFGSGHPVPPVFPLLVKILDAQQDLSLQVHPPIAKAAELRGDPKTEMWYFTSTSPEARLYVGLRSGVFREEFERRAHDGTVAECFHQIPVRAGDSMFLPSGRVHALGAGSVLFEIQQNSDTTYRVFDWNRVDASGKPRDLHVAQSLASIDFADFEPDLIRSGFESHGPLRIQPLVDDPLFRVRVCELAVQTTVALPLASFQILGVVGGELKVKAESGDAVLKPGQFCLLPASLRVVEVKATKDAQFLQVMPGRAEV